MKLLRPTKHSQIYDNCKMYSPEGTLLANCPSHRMNWYLKRNLATKMSATEFKLIFTPKGNGHADDVPYMLEPRENRCVVCGTLEDLTLHHIVPRCYRKHFPTEYKSRNHFDVVCVCHKCHDAYEQKANRLHKSLRDSFIPKQEKSPPIHDTEARKKENARKAVRALLRHPETIPSEQQRVLLDRIETFVGRPVCREELEQIGIEFGLLGVQQIRSTPIVPGPNSGDAYRGFVEKIGDLFGFIVMWRQHFLDHAQPKYMSTSWLENYKTRVR